MGLPKISVIIPSYNKVKFIGRTLESIFSQKYNNLEVIVQDGASTDGTVKIIEKYADKYPKTLFWESKKDSGQLDAINKGLGHAGGDIVTYINADDCYLYGSFERVADAYQSNPNALWFAGQGLVVDRQGREIAKLASLYTLKYLQYAFKFQLFDAAIRIFNDENLQRVRSVYGNAKFCHRVRLVAETWKNSNAQSIND